jgi:NADH-quinone oxidoreductase subunit M
MDVTYLLILLFAGALATYFSGDKLASKVALLLGWRLLGYRFICCDCSRMARALT